MVERELPKLIMRARFPLPAPTSQKLVVTDGNISPASKFVSVETSPSLMRVWGVLTELAKQPYSIMGIAIHGGTMAALLNYFKFDFAKIPNCAVFCLVYEDGTFSIDGGLF